MADLRNPFLGYQFGQFGYKDQIRGLFGGSSAYIDPYTTGYHLIVFTLPNKLAGKNNIGKFLTTACQSVTGLPNIQSEPIEYNGLNNAKWYVPGVTTLENQRITVKFTEFAGLPILQIMGEWVNIYRNTLYGIASEGGATQGAYKGSALYTTTLPDMETVQFAAIFPGIWPVRVPISSFNSDRATQEKVEPEIEFAFDAPLLMGEEVLKKAQELVKSIKADSISYINSDRIAVK